MVATAGSRRLEKTLNLAIAEEQKMVSEQNGMQ